ncbi:hypothetical protein ACWIGG_28915 [Micromonospora aurantiaca (nom. illeg.)]|uniref:hypothetical protein n=1 Tax=Micromonospora aurantiaca (nom. illeg.) TaxID=47850 RepID=UPI00365B5A25
MAKLLAEHGRIEEAIGLHRKRLDAGNELAAGDLAELLAEHGLARELEVEVPQVLLRPLTGSSSRPI